MTRMFNNGICFLDIAEMYLILNFTFFYANDKLVIAQKPSAILKNILLISAEAVAPRCSAEKVFLEIPQNLPCARVSVLAA